MNIQNVQTSAGRISVLDAGAGDPTVLLLHGNSGHKDVFGQQVAELAPLFRAVAPDLAGHGQSDDAVDAARDYTLAGQARYLAELVAAMGIGPVVVAGVSLGGHIGLELVGQLPNARGLMLVGTPPFAKTIESIGGAWVAGPAIELSGKAELSEVDVEAFVAAHAIDDTDFAGGLRRAVARADGRSRTTVVGALLAEQAADQRELVRQCAVPIAVVNGSADSAVNLEFIEAAPYRQLWRGQPFRIAGAGHMPQASHPREFNELLMAFVRDCAG